MTGMVQSNSIQIKLIAGCLFDNDQHPHEQLTLEAGLLPTTRLRAAVFHLSVVVLLLSSLSQSNLLNGWCYFCNFDTIRQSFIAIALYCLPDTVK